jgi:hypothetical protein
MSKKYIQKIQKSELFSDRVKKNSNHLLEDLKKLYESSNKSQIKIKKDLIQTDIDELKTHIGLI